MNKFDKSFLSDIPTTPGCYLWKNDKGEIIYIGKANNLKNRMTSYFKGTVDNKTMTMVSLIQGYEIHQTKTDIEALLLEFNLIKKHKPYYNIKLKNSSSLPYIVITNDKNPSLKYIRNIKDPKKYKEIFGPLPDGYGGKKLYELLNNMYPLKRCKNKPNTTKCVYYDIDLCLGGCFKEVSEADYNKNIKKIKAFFNGSFKEVKDELAIKLEKASDNTEYEKASEYKNRLVQLESLSFKQSIYLKTKENLDVINYSIEKDYLSLSIAFVRDGLVVGMTNYIQKILKKEDIIFVFLNHYEKNLKPTKILMNKEEVNDQVSKALDIEVKTPIKGQKNELLNLTLENSIQQLKLRIGRYMRMDQIFIEGNKELRKLIDSKKITSIWAYDSAFDRNKVSVGSRIVLKNNEYDKSQYRLYNVENDEKVNSDLTILKEILYRSIQRTQVEKKPLPDLIIIDGGITQYNMAKKMLETFNLEIDLISLKKNNKHQTESVIFLGEDHALNKESNLYLMLSNIQDEVHRFSINYYRKKQSKNIYK